MRLRLVKAKRRVSAERGVRARRLANRRERVVTAAAMLSWTSRHRTVGPIAAQQFQSIARLRHRVLGVNPR